MALASVIEGIRPFAVPAASKLPSSEDDNGVIAHFLGVPVGFQFGTAAGLTGLPALLVDILTDPITWLAPGLGGLTRAGKAGQVLSEGSKLLPLAERALNAGAKTLPEVQAFWKTPLLRAAQLETHSFTATKDVLAPFLQAGDRAGAEGALRDLLTMKGDRFVPHATEVKSLISTLQTGGMEGLSAALEGGIAKRETLQSLVTNALSSGDRATALDAMKQITKIAPTQRWKELFSGKMRSAWKAAFEEAKAGKAIEPLAQGARAQAEAGQRALLSVVLPGQGRKALVKGAGAVGAVAEKAAKLGFGEKAVKAAEILDTPLGELGASPFTLHESGLKASAAIDYSTKQAIDAGNLSLDGAELLKSREEMRLNHAELARQYGAQLRVETEATFTNMGLTRPLDRELTNELLQNPAKYYGEGQQLNAAATAAGITDKHAMVAEAVSGMFRSFGQTAMKSGILNSLLPDYMARSVEILPGKEEEFRKAMGSLGSAATDTQTFWRHAQERTIPAWDQLIDLEKRGIVRVQKDPGKLIQNYVTSMGKITADAGFLDGMVLSRIPSEIAGKGGAKRDVLLHLIIPSRSAKFAAKTGAYTEVRDPSILRLAEQIGARTGVKGFYGAGSVYVHDSIVGQLRGVIERGFPSYSGLSATATGPEKLMSGLLSANSIAKRFLLFPGAVHLVNLGEKLLVTNGWDGFKEFMGKNLPNLVKPPSARSYLETLPLMERAVRSGLRLDIPIDSEVETFQKALNFVSKNLPVTKPVIDAVRSMDQWASGKLWGQYHAPMKLYAWNELVSRTAAKFPTLAPEVFESEIAKHINASFGGGNLERFVGSKKGQQIMRLFFLAPDWSIGNVSVATDVFSNLFVKERALLPAGTVLAQDARAFFARQYALRAGLMMAFTAQFVNAAFTGHFMFENEDPTRIQLPATDDKGKPVYLAMFDHFMAPFDLAGSPMEFIGRKASPVARIVSTAVIGHDFTGAPIVAADDGPMKAVGDWMGFAAKQLAVPIGFQQPSRIPVGLQALSFAGFPVRGSKAGAKQIDETAPAETPRKTKQELRAEVQAEMQQEIEKAVGRFSEAHSLMMKSDQYRRGLDQAANMPVVPAGAMLPVVR